MSEAATPSAGPAAAVDPGALMRSKQYRRLLLLAALVGLVVSFAAWCFLELISRLQPWIYEDLPAALGFAAMPWWWPLPVLAIAGLLTAFAVYRLPGTGGHIPYQGLKAGASQPVELAGIVAAALASIGLGLVLGPEAPLIAGGGALAIWAVRLLRKDTPDQVLSIVAAAAAFAAIASLFGSPIIGAVIIIEAAGLGGAMLPVILLPGLVAAGIGSLVFLGLGTWAGLSSNDYALAPLALPAMTEVTAAQILWTIPLALVAAVVVSIVLEGSRRSDHVVKQRPWLLMPMVAVLVGVFAVVFAALTDLPATTVLFSGQDAFNALIDQAPTLSLVTLVLLFVFKGAAWSLSMGSFRGGPTFPALFLGAVAGLMAADLPGMSETPAVAALLGAMAVSVLRLPLSAVLLATLMTTSGGLDTAPIIIVSVVVAYIATLVLAARRSDAPPAADISSTPAAA